MTPTTIPRSAVVAACADMIRACGLTVAEIVDELAKPQQAAPLLTLPVIDQRDLQHAPPAPKPSQRSGPALSQQAQQILAYADGPEGATTGDVTDLLGVHYATGAYHCERLVRARLLTKAKVRGEHAFRYWSNPGHALAYVDAKAQAFADQQAAEQQAEQLRHRDAEARAADQAGQREERAAKAAAPKPEKPAPMPVAPQRPKPVAKQNISYSQPKPPPDEVKPKGEAIEDENTVRIIDDKVRPNNRLDAAPPLPPDPRWPSFSSTPFGVNPDTGRSWEARA